MNQGIYGQYNIEVLKENSESYYPFGTGFQKNIILDDFFSKVLSGWRHSPQAWIQTCITNTGNNPATRFDTTGTFGVPNDKTWASTVFATGVNTGENRISMSRDFIFNALTGTRLYREAMVGLFYKNDSNASGQIQSDIATSHFVFPSDIILESGDRLKISYNLNLILDYLSTGYRFELSGNNYNFNGTIKFMGAPEDIFGELDATSTTFTYDSFSVNPYYGNKITKNINANTNAYNAISELYSVPSNSFLGGTKLAYNQIGFYGQSFTPGVYPSQFSPGFASTAISGAAATISSGNFQIDNNGASIDVDYYFSPSGVDRNVSGILLTHSRITSLTSHAVVYLQFDTGQKILANDPISMRLRWSFKRL